MHRKATAILGKVIDPWGTHGVMQQKGTTVK
jgi:hypothetical protein